MKMVFVNMRTVGVKNWCQAGRFNSSLDTINKESFPWDLASYEPLSVHTNMKTTEPWIPFMSPPQFKKKQSIDYIFYFLLCISTKNQNW
jgi:hypothetical protein